MWRNLNPHTLLIGMKDGTDTTENSLAFPQILNTELPYDQEVLFLGICPRETQVYVHTKTCSQVFIAALFTTAERWKEINCPSTDDWINKISYIHTIKCYSAIQRNEVLIHGMI